MTRKLLTAQLAEAFAAARLLGTLHCLRHTFAMAMLARLQIQARTNPDLNPLKVVQVLLGHASITTTAIYLRCVELHERDLSESLAYLYGELITADRSEEHTSELQSLMRIAYAVFCWKKQNYDTRKYHHDSRTI